ncbi:DUF3016 domain-containing protein [Aliidiomarina quisquiliarum]|uniref:DUF3016 domain-containing protein n=1 Tax=Aliidiomarina quisquiliarum TaxID=2938947 RepID=UPI00208FEA55|nr:DUF3016 domain-containing protein [Aliidiomarina quisquiliarum]MCO4321176.1 DUF3016 domain-containing protein [Aliidiomarina quisquiliarum]
MKLKILFLSLFIFANAAVAAEVTVDWHEPNNYTDVESPYVDRDNDFLNVRFGRIERHLVALGKMHFTAGETLQLKITDYDMAGTLVPQASASGQQPLVRRELLNDQPKMVLSFTLTDANGKVLKEGADIEIEGRAIRTEGRALFPKITRRDKETVGAELVMLNRWFKETFID